MPSPRQRINPADCLRLREGTADFPCGVHGRGNHDAASKGDLIRSYATDPDRNTQRDSNSGGAQCLYRSVIVAEVDAPYLCGGSTRDHRILRQPQRRRLDAH